MQFLDYKDLPPQGINRTFKNASWRSLLWVVLIMALITAYVAIPKGEATNPVLIAVPALATVFFGLLFLWQVWRCRNHRNWLLKASEEGLYINLQSNVGVPLAGEVPTVLFLPDEAIATITRVQEFRTIPARNGAYKNTIAYFDIVLHEALPEALLVALARIRRNPAIRGATGIRRDLRGAIRIENDHAIRLIWDWMSPRELATEAWFGERYALGEHRKITGPGWEKMTPEVQEAYIDTLWEWGDVQDAIHLKSMRDGISERAAARELANRLG